MSGHDWQARGGMSLGWAVRDHSLEDVGRGTRTRARARARLCGAECCRTDRTGSDRGAAQGARLAPDMGLDENVNGSASIIRCVAGIGWSWLEGINFGAARGCVRACDRFMNGRDQYHSSSPGHSQSHLNRANDSIHRPSSNHRLSMRRAPGHGQSSSAHSSCAGLGSPWEYELTFHRPALQTALVPSSSVDEEMSLLAASHERRRPARIDPVSVHLIGFGLIRCWCDRCASAI